MRSTSIQPSLDGTPAVIGAMAVLLSQMHWSPSRIAQVAAVEALEGDQFFIPENRKVLQRRRDLVIQRVDQMPGFSALQPEGTFYAFLGCSALIGRTSGGARRLESDIDVVEALLDEAGVAAVPGTAFGMSPFVRISFALPDEMLDRAMDRMDAFARAVT
jgi:aspartate aminotransferase